MGNSFSFFLGGTTEEPIAQRRNGNSLLIIDPQVDFHPGGSLGIPGADQDSERTAQMIRNNINKIDDVFVTLDSHHLNHIAHGVFWKNAEGQSPSPFTLITPEDIEAGKWTPRDPALLSHALAYTHYLKSQGKFTLCIWPVHCLIGTAGHAVQPVLNAALQEWATARGKDIRYIMKGQNCLTEMYSAIKADFEIKSDPGTQRSVELQNALQDCKQLIVCGQALSHCVHFTFQDILDTWPEKQRSQLVLLQDASTSVPGFEAQGEAFVTQIKAAGCRLSTTSTVFNENVEASRTPELA